MLGESGKGVHLSTFHSPGVRILMETIHHLVYRLNFLMYDTQDQLALIRSLMENEGLDNSPLINPKSVYQTFHQETNQGSVGKKCWR